MNPFTGMFQIFCPSSYVVYLKKLLILIPNETRFDEKLKCEFLFDSHLFRQLKILCFLTFEYEMRSKQDAYM